MIEPRLQLLLTLLEETQRKARLSRALAIWWGVLTLVILAQLLVRSATGHMVLPPMLAVLIGGLAVAFGIWLWFRRRSKDLSAVVEVLERDHPETRPLLSTALEQRVDPVSGQWTYLQKRLIDQVLSHPQRSVWRRQFSRRRFAGMAAHTLALLAFILVFSLGTVAPPQAAKPWLADTITVEPGDVELERGNGVVVTIRFDKQPPQEATLVVSSTAGEIRKIPLERHLDDPLFGASLRDVREDSVYRIEYGTEKTRDYAIKVFEFPALMRADASLSFPEYTGLTNKTIPDTLRVSAVEGSRLDYTFQLNKPVPQARLVSKEQTLTLISGSNGVMMLNGFVLTNSGRYALQLVDAEGRTNKRTSEVVLQVLPNRRPDLKLAFPRGDQRVSNLQELQLQAEVADDFGLVKYGFGFGVGGAEPELLELGQTAGANEKRQITRAYDLERLALAVDQVVSYFVWADDFGPEGEVRRTYSDMFFAEIRPFEEIFRADQSSGGGEEQGQQGGQQGGGGGGNEPTRLTELQKQIVIATWKIQREKGAPGESKP